MKLRKKPRIIFNDDTCSLRWIKPPYMPEKVSVALEYLKDTQVDCLCWLVAEDIAYSYPSKVLENMYDIIRDKGLKQTNNLMYSLHCKGIDYLPFMIKQARKRRINFFASFRMNDTHFKSHPSGVLSSKFWQEHQHYRLWDVTDGASYYNATTDYSYAVVRNRKIRAICECAEMYDVDGIELDFGRNPYTFPQTKAWSKRKILTAFIKDIRDRLNALGSERGRKINLLIRVPFTQDRFTKASENRLILAGMDVKDWIKKKYTDILVMSCLANNFNQQVEPWLTLCRANDILFYPSVEAGVATNAAHNHVVPETIDETITRQRGAAQNILAQGTDGVYMFNYPCILNEHKRTETELKKLTGVLSEMGCLKTLKDKAKQYTFWQDLPIWAESNRPPQHHQIINFAVHNSNLKSRNTKVAIVFRQIAKKNPHSPGKYYQNPIAPPGWITYYLNGRKIERKQIKTSKQCGGMIPSGFNLNTHEKIKITVPASMMITGENTLAFHIDRFPAEKDPYVYIYELVVDVIPKIVGSER